MMPMSLLLSSLRASSLSTLIHSEWSPKFSLIFTIKFQQRIGQYKLFKVHHNLVYLGERIPKNNEHTEIVNKVLELKIKWVTQEWDSNLSKLVFEWTLEEMLCDIPPLSRDGQS
jgi:hypothetical protein